MLMMKPENVLAAATTMIAPAAATAALDTDLTAYA